ncbi:MAG: hypothetical protein NTV06_01800 [candidate division Zixibacteria bacterium]|nr:hypothetical protein [candidate division Zixibacteria bacterium]
MRTLKRVEKPLSVVVLLSFIIAIIFGVIIQPAAAAANGPIIKGNPIVKGGSSDQPLSGCKWWQVNCWVKVMKNCYKCLQNNNSTSCGICSTKDPGIIDRPAN